MKSAMIRNEQEHFKTETDLHSSTLISNRINGGDSSKDKTGVSYFSAIIEEEMISFHGLEPAIDDEVVARHSSSLMHVSNESTDDSAHNNQLRPMRLDSQIVTPQGDPELFEDIFTSGPAIDDVDISEHASSYFA
ncbi:MAG: hypothetical protein KDJ65_24950 [Anaerolineae bacterium]|nr:hypothetical protein [Anaerolineae bacterium]